MTSRFCRNGNRLEVFRHVVLVSCLIESVSGAGSGKSVKYESSPRRSVAGTRIEDRLKRTCEDPRLDGRLAS